MRTLDKFHQPPDLIDDSGQLCRVCAGDLGIVVPHILAEGRDVVAKVRQGLLSAKPFVKQGNIRQTGGQTGKRGRCVGRGRHRIRLHIADGSGISRQIKAEQHQIVTKVRDIVVPCEESHKASAVWDGVCQRHQRLPRCGRIDDRFRVQTCHSQ